MSIEVLKEELNKFSLEELEPLFKKILSTKRKEAQEKQEYLSCIQKLYSILLEIHSVSEQKRRTLMLFKAIGCETDDFVFSSDDVVNKLTVGQLIRTQQYACRHIRLRHTDIPTDEYTSELNKNFNKFSSKITNPQYINVIRNSLVAREIITKTTSENDIFNDIFRMFRVR